MAPSEAQTRSHGKEVFAGEEYKSYGNTIIPVNVDGRSGGSVRLSLSRETFKTRMRSIASAGPCHRLPET